MKLKPILVKSNKRTLLVIENTILKTIKSYTRITDNMQFYDIVLVDTKAEIVKGDLCINKNLDTIYSPNCLGNTLDWIKILAINTQYHNKYYNIPKLSKDSIKLLSNYYSYYDMLPEFVYVNNDLTYIDTVNDIKLDDIGNVDIIISDIEERLYTKDEVNYTLNNILNDVLCKRVDKDLIRQPDSNKISKFVTTWINNHK